MNDTDQRVPADVEGSTKTDPTDRALGVCAAIAISLGVYLALVLFGVVTAPSLVADFAVEHNDASAALGVVGFLTGIFGGLFGVVLFASAAMPRSCVVTAVVFGAVFASGLLTLDAERGAQRTLVERLETKYDVTVNDYDFDKDDNGFTSWTIDGTKRLCDASGVTKNPDSPVLLCASPFVDISTMTEPRGSS